MSDITWQNETRKLSDLVPWEHNPKQLTEAQGESLRVSLDKFGLALPLLIDEENNLYDGHQRQHLLEGMNDYGPNAIIDVRVSSRPLTWDEQRELVIRLRENQAGWDFDALGNIYDVEELQEWGFPDWKISEFMPEDDTNEGADAEPQVDKAEELQEKWQVETGQMWKLGEHRVICGDCTDPAVVERVMDGEKADCVVTDPPYGINREGIQNDDPEGLRTLFDGCFASMPIMDAILIAFQSPRLFPVWLDALRAAGQKFERALWFYDETDVTFPWRGWLMTSQIALVSSAGSPTWNDKGPYHHDCYMVKTAGMQDDSGGHTTVKPLDVVQDLVAHTTGIVYDPFLGSGTTLIACENLNRRCRGVEISPAYIAVTLQRWHDLTGDMPELIE